MTASYQMNPAASICQSPYTCQEPRPCFRPLHPPLKPSCLIGFSFQGNQPLPIYKPPQTFQEPQPIILPFQLLPARTAPYPLNWTTQTYLLPAKTAPYPLNWTTQTYQSPYTCQEPRPSFRPSHPPLPEPCPDISQIGANNQTLVSLEDFQEKFAIPYMYSDTTKPWPHTTILLYKYSSHAITKYQAIPENTWQRIDNDPRHGYYPGEHAESIMITKLTEIQEHLKQQPDYERESYNGIHTIEVILSYSPCNKDPHYCSTKLLDFRNTLEKDVSALGLMFGGNFPIDEDDDIATTFQPIRIKGKVTMNITFANFYQHYYKENMEGLKELLENKIELDILTGDKWLYFFDAVRLDRTTELHVGRTNREKVDEKMFEKLMQEINKLKTIYDV